MASLSTCNIRSALVNRNGSETEEASPEVESTQWRELPPISGKPFSQQQKQKQSPRRPHCSDPVTEPGSNWLQKLAAFLFPRSLPGNYISQRTLQCLFFLAVYISRVVSGLPQVHGELDWLVKIKTSALWRRRKRAAALSLPLRRGLWEM